MIIRTLRGAVKLRAYHTILVKFNEISSACVISLMITILLNLLKDAFGLCTCDDGFTEHLSGTYCVTCSGLSGVGANEENGFCSCDTYAKADENGVCHCLSNYIETSINTCHPCDELSEIASIPGECACIDNAMPNEFGVCDCATEFALSEDASQCVPCPLSGLISNSDSCSCTDFAFLDNNGSCSCHEGFIANNIGE